ncbi:YcaO-like family protein, partial [Bacillus pacificus]|nr:YcaO-like family protein [Bacillus pacificus]
MHINWEREHSLNDALKKGIDACKELNITVGYENIGNVLDTEYVELFDQQGKQLTSGVGKGGGIKSKVGALFEALEHYLTEYKIDYSKQKLFLLEDIPNINRFEKEKIIQLLHSDSNKEKLISCKKYKLLENPSKSVWYPSFITNPFYADNPKYPEQEIDYSQFKRYSSNSGTAIGCSLNEALIHAINEVVERDAISLFLLDYYYYRNNNAIKLIYRSSLPSYLQKFLEKAEEELQQEIELIDITTEINVPVIFAVLKENNMSIPLYGAGASLYRDYAVIRAISELVQSNHMIRTYPGAYKEAVENINYFKGFPNHYICAEFNTNTLLQAFEIEYIDFKEMNNYSSNNLNDYLNYLIQLLNKQDFNIYYSILNKFSNDIHLVNVIIPNTERFFNVLMGQIVFPSDRGKLKNNAID